MDPERLIGQAKNKISSLGNKIPEKKIVPKILELFFLGPMTRSKKKKLNQKSSRFKKHDPKSFKCGINIVFQQIERDIIRQVWFAAI